jgi:glycosyltransferase involved in cell wall biosynthesis
MKQLLTQCENYQEVEILGLFDNKKRTVGEKRQDLLNLARGKYLVFIDDDDRISDDYVSEILNAIKNNTDTDCIVFDCICCENNSHVKTHCKYGIEFEYGHLNCDKKEWRGKPAHTMVYKSSIAKSHCYESTNYGEDINWVVRACKDIKHQTRIDKVLYYYDCQSLTTSETRGLSNNTIKQNIEKLIETVH